MRLFSFCGTTGKNTGGIDCDARFGNPRMLLVGGAKFTPTEYATEAALKAAILDRINRANGDSEKLYPFPVINTVTNNTEAPTRETLGDGTQRALREGRPSYTFESGFVGVNQEAAMMEFNNATMPTFTLDDTGKFIGKFDSDNNFIGAKVQLYTTPAGLGTYAAGTTTKVEANWMDSKALSANAMFYETSFDTDDFEGLLDATLIKLANPTGNAHKIGVIIKNKSIGKDQNAYNLYSAELADVDMFIGVAVDDGAEIAPTTVVVDAALKGWTVTFPEAVNLIKLAPPDELYAADITGIEGVDLAVA